MCVECLKYDLGEGRDMQHFFSLWSVCSVV